MIILKKKYFLLIEDIKDIKLSNLKLINKFIIIYRNQNKYCNFNKLLEFRRICKVKKIDFYISNDTKLMKSLNADGLYISAYNTSLQLSRYRNSKYNIIGSAHNRRDLSLKTAQGCSYIIFSRLFKVKDPNKRGFLGVIKFNLFKLSIKENLVPLGGINFFNLNKMKMVNSSSLAILSEIKKKPAKIFNRLF